jgi:GNAT superfamily N-acetyltransferase
MIKIIADNNKKLKNKIDIGLTEFNREKCEWLKRNSNNGVDEYQEKEFNFLVYDDNKLIGGAIGFIQYDWYFLDMLYIDEKYRKRKIGTSLINELENFAQKEKLVGIRTDTWDFQAKEFYKKMGFKLFGELKDCPLGTIDYFFEKKIGSDNDERQ